jgi:hypothetical protein
VVASLGQIARKLRERVENAVESGLFGPDMGNPLGPTHLSYTEFAKSIHLKNELLSEFKGSSLEQYYSAERIENQYGTCLKITHTVDIEVSLCDPTQYVEDMSRELKLLYGVGPSIESSLRDSGIETLTDLCDHPRWGDQASRLITTLNSNDARIIQKMINRWFPVSHPLGCRLISLINKGKLIFFDLESLGLFGRPVVLLGLAHITNEGLEVTQYLPRDIMEELPALMEVGNQLEGEPALVTYNGKSFDTNFIEERWAYYGLNFDFEPIHFDLLHPARRKFRGSLPDVRLETVEQHYGLNREIDLPGALVPDFYNTFLETRNIGPLIPIIEHNKQDLVTLGMLLTEFTR